MRLHNALAIAFLILTSPYGLEAQTIEAIPKLEMLSRPNQIGATIDMLYRIKATVETYYKGRELNVYRLVSERLTGCSLLYAILAKTPNGDATQQRLYNAALMVYSQTGSFLFPDGIEAYKRSVDRTQPIIISLRDDQQKLFYYLRNCKDFSDPQTIVTAVQEILIK